MTGKEKPMRRRAQSAKPKFEATPPVAPKSRKSEGTRVRDIEKRLAEGLERERATGEILRVISSSPTDAQPVFDAILSSALRLCDGLYGGIFMERNGQIVLEALTNISDEARAVFQSVYPTPLDSPGMVSSAIREGVVLHVPDVSTYPRAGGHAARLGEVTGYRCLLVIPLIKQGHPIGALALARVQPEPFSAEQVTLVQAFADQAVIAIENVRLFNETKDALEQQTATSEILRIISTSPTDIRPVLDAVAESAARLCESLDSAIYRREGNRLLLVAHHGPIPYGSIGAFSIPVSRGMVNGRAVLEGQPVQVADLPTETDEYPEGAAMARQWGHRTMLGVPLMHNGVAIGSITLRRAEVKPFTTRQIALLQTLADQAVIAIENVRVFAELQDKNRALTQAHAQVTEALDQQTATAEILRVISSSPTDIQPVFDAIVRGASGLLGGLDCIAVRFDGTLMHLLARHNPRAGTREVLTRLYPQPPTRTLTIGRVILDKTIVHIPDVREDAAFDQRYAELLRLRGVLAVPIKRDDSVIGGISVSRSTPGHFSDRQIALLQTFADQAVIAIENVRLFTELQEKNKALTQAHAQITEALAQQTATREILEVISGSPTDVQPAFDAIVRSAAHLCDARDASIYQCEGDVLRCMSNYGHVASATVGATRPITRGTGSGRAILEGRTVHMGTR